MERITSIRIDNDEGRFVLVFETDEEIFAFDLHDVALDFAADVRRSGLLRYADEAEDARATMPRPVTTEDLEAYERNDPKRVELQRAIDRGGF